jgi:endonuclease YncB( thermonuclease family)
MRPRIALAVVLSVAAVSAHVDLAGSARVIDGDTIVINGEHVRLQGIDAPETDQTCNAYGREWPCGRTAAEWLRDNLRGRQVECIGHARDRYQRLLAVCYIGGESINERLVREGWALDFRKYSTDYLRAESEAKRAGRRHLARRIHPTLGVARGSSLSFATRTPVERWHLVSP